MNDEVTEHIMQGEFWRWSRANLARYPVLALLAASVSDVECGQEEASRLKRRGGLVRGVPDMQLPAPRWGYCGLWLEFKLPGRGLRPEQLDWFRLLNAEGHFCTMAV